MTPGPDRPRVSTLLGVLGIVYGDIGTSPLYALKASLEHFTPGGLEQWEVLGVLSLVIWSLLIVVTLKYVLLIMRADNRGEGGILALMALAQRVVPEPRLRVVLTMLGIGGACLFFGDGAITPAISVLSAVEGLQITSPALRTYVIPISIGVIVALFAAQWRGTGRVGSVFGPIMLVWFIVLAVLGARAIVANPVVLMALSPTYGVQVLVNDGWLAFVALGSVVLAVTGAEALYADMGHFGRTPIRQMWIALVLPALALNYLGQGALVLTTPGALSNPFYLLCPDTLRLPLVILATMATVIASQALISGAFSVARQCTQLGFLPRMTVVHTSATEEGQIYLPQINGALFIGVLGLVLAFRTSDNLAAAYGIAVTATFLCTCVIAGVVYRRQFGWPIPAVILTFGSFVVIDGVFFASNALKIPSGGWVPLVLGAALVLLMTSWKRGRDLLLARWRADSLTLSSFLARLPQSRTIRVPGMAVFLTGTPDYVPGALLHNLKHNKVLHERVLFVTIVADDVPEVSVADRAEVVLLAPGIHRIVIHYGFMESPNLPRDLLRLREREVAFDPMQVSYFLSRETIVAASVSRLSLWRRAMFLLLARNAVSATEFFRIPSDRVVEVGVRVAV